MKFRSWHVLLMLTKILTCCSPRTMAHPKPQGPPNVSGKSNAPASVPKYVIDYAPLVWLNSKEVNLPSDMGAQLLHTTPKQTMSSIASLPIPLNLETMDQLNLIGANGTDVYLTANDDVTKNPAWIKGVLPDADGKTQGATSCVVIVAEKGNGIVDAFYFHFYAFNWGGITVGKVLGNHIGDWEHNMVRFVNGKPSVVYFSQHAAGQTFKYSAVKKDKSGLRPIAYSGIGSHALYATSGTHNHDDPDLILPTPGIVNDYTDEGTLWDPIQSAYWYSWAPEKTSSVPAVIHTSNATAVASHAAAAATHITPPAPVMVARDTKTLGVFTPYDAQSPVGPMYFKGRWGDYQYPDNDPKQEKIEIFGFKIYKYVTGPEGPAFKNLGRKDPWQASHGRVLDNINIAV